MWKLLVENTEKWLFRLLAVGLFGFALFNLQQLQVPEFAALFAVAFFCWFYANIARFKRFKGFGFEAELWEDKQREAVRLIDRLKVLVGLYSGELLSINITKGRWGSGRHLWREVAELYSRLEEEHSRLGADIDLGEARIRLKTYFVFDAIQLRLRKLREIVEEGISQARMIIESEFGPENTDQDGRSRRLAQVNEVRSTPSDEEPIRLAERSALATEVLTWIEKSTSSLKTNFGVVVNVPPDMLSELRLLQTIELGGPIELDEKNLALVSSND